MSSVLFDTPGPVARARYRTMTIIAGVVLLAVTAWVLWTLAKKGEFDSDVWDGMARSNIARAYWDGLLTTLKAAASAIVLAVALGALLAVARLSDRAWVRWPAWLFTEFFRAVPLLLLIMFVYFGWLHDLYWSLVIALMLYNGSVLAEVFRAGVQAVPSGQAEAAYAIGLRKGQVLRLVQFPQAIAIMLPAIISQCVIVLKDTALGTIVGYFDLVAVGRNIAQYLHASVIPLTVTAVIFIVINYSLSRLAIWVQARMSKSSHSSAVGGDPMEADTGA
jgi:glutamate transport system permease protein